LLLKSLPWYSFLIHIDNNKYAGGEEVWEVMTILVLGDYRRRLFNK
jgi:hypothetical protein